MKNDELPEGTVVQAEVVAHQEWGVEVRLLTGAPGALAVIDVLYVTNERPFEAFRDYPPVGAKVRAVVMPAMPSGQLRLSTRDSDLDAVESDDR